MSAPVVVVGGSLGGLATALALAAYGFPVHVLDRAAPAPKGPPGKAVDHWARPTVPQSAHSHVLTSLGVRVLRERAGRVLDEALAQGARLLDLTASAPRPDGRLAPEPGDGDLVALAVRRGVLDLVLQQVVHTTPGITVSHGSAVADLLLDPDGHAVRGVLTADGERIDARIVVDATGRQAQSQAWLAAAGIPLERDLVGPNQTRGFSRFYTLDDPAALPGPLNRGNAAGGVWDHYGAVVHLADNGGFSVVLMAPGWDQATRALRDPQSFTAVARLSPFLEPWAGARPLTGVRAIAMPPNVLRGGARRPVLGLFPVGDAVCVTDPTYGRGMSLALAHAFALADLLHEHPAVDQAQAERARGLTARLLEPWYHQAVRDAATRDRLWRQTCGRPVPPEEPAAPGGLSPAQVGAAAATDATVWRAVVRTLMTLRTPADTLGDPALQERIRAAAAAAATAPRPALAIPSRTQLLDAIAAQGER